MKVKTTLAIVSMVLLCCKKNDNDSSSTKPVLVKMESITNGDTVTTSYQYSAGKITLIQSSGIFAGNVTSSITRFDRNSAGIVETITIKNPTNLNTFFSDSIFYKIIYSSTEKRYTGMVNTLFFKNGSVEYDSIYFSFDAMRSLEKVTKFVKNQTGSTYTEVERNEFTYSDRNLVLCKNYIANTLFLNQYVQYDNKINPTSFGNDWMLVASTRNNRRFEQSSPNNAIIISYDHNNGTQTSLISSYTYNGVLPSTKNSTASSGMKTTVKFFYQ